MFEVKAGSLLSPIVKTSTDGGLSMEDLADACVSKILSVSETAPPEIREQAKIVKEKLRVLILNYLKKLLRITKMQLNIKGKMAVCQLKLEEVVGQCFIKEEL